MFPDLVPVRRALISVSDKTGLVALAGPRGARGRAPLHRRHGAGAARRRAAGARRGEVDRVSGDARRPGEDAAPDGARGPARAARPPDHAAALDEYGIAPIDLLVVNLYPFEATVRRGATTTPASRTSTSAGRRCCARRRRTTASSRSSPTSRTTAPLLAELERHRRRHLARLPPRGGAHRLRPHGGLRRGGFGLDGRGAGGGRAAAAELRGHAGAAAPLRREPAPGARPSTATAAAGRGSRRRGSCRARRSPTTTSTTPTPPSSWWRSSRPGRPGLRHHQARQPLRRGAGRDAPAGLPRRLRLRPHLGVRRHRGAQRPARRRDGGGDRRDLHRGGDRAGGDEAAAEVFAAKKNLRLLVTGGLPDARRPVSPGGRSPAAFWCRAATTVASARADLRSSPAARPRRPSSATCASPGRWPST